MKDTKITKERIQNHMVYSWWKYVLLVIFAVVGWNLVYTMTKYQPPPDKRLSVYFVTYPISSESMELLQNSILQEIPELEEVNVISVVLTEEDDYYGSMQLSTYVGAGEGDIFIMSSSQFNRFAGSGAFFPLEEAIEADLIQAKNISTGKGLALNEDTGDYVLCGVPADTLYGLMEYDIDNRDLIISIMGYSKNVDKAIQCVNWFIETMTAPKPEWVAQIEAEQNTAIDDKDVDYPSY